MAPVVAVGALRGVVRASASEGTANSAEKELESSGDPSGTGEKTFFAVTAYIDKI